MTETAQVERKRERVSAPAPRLSTKKEESALTCAEPLTRSAVADKMLAPAEKFLIVLRMTLMVCRWPGA